MDNLSVGNPTTILVERIAYLGIGIFFLAAVFTSFLRSRKDQS